MDIEAIRKRATMGTRAAGERGTIIALCDEIERLRTENERLRMARDIAMDSSLACQEMHLRTRHHRR